MKRNRKFSYLEKWLCISNWEKKYLFHSNLFQDISHKFLRCTGWVPLFHSYILQRQKQENVKALYYVLDNVVIPQIYVGHLQYRHKY